MKQKINTLTKLRESIYDKSDAELDFEHTNLYGGDPTYCRTCGSKLVQIDDDETACPECEGAKVGAQKWIAKGYKYVGHEDIGNYFEDTAETGLDAIVLEKPEWNIRLYVYGSGDSDMIQTPIKEESHDYREGNKYYDYDLDEALDTSLDNNYDFLTIQDCLEGMNGNVDDEDIDDFLKFTRKLKRAITSERTDKNIVAVVNPDIDDSNDNWQAFTSTSKICDLSEYVVIKELANGNTWYWFANEEIGKEYLGERAWLDESLQESYEYDYKNELRSDVYNALANIWFKTKKHNPEVSDEELQKAFDAAYEWFAIHYIEGEDD